MQSFKNEKANHTILCSKCGHKINKNNIFIIDNKPICSVCIYGNRKPFKIYPIGIVGNKLKRNGSDFSSIGKQGSSRLELFPSQKPFMYELEKEKYLTIIYYLHKTRPVKSIFERGLDGKKVGVFASRTPDRLSRIAVQDVKLVKIKGTTIYVEGLDAIDGSPVLDIKLAWNAL